MKKYYFTLLVLLTSCGSKWVYDYSSPIPDCYLYETDYSLESFSYGFAKEEKKSFLDEKNDLDILVFSSSSGVTDYSLQRFTFKHSLNEFDYVYYRESINVKEKVEKTIDVNPNDLNFLINVNEAKSYMQYCEKYHGHTKGSYFLIKRKGKMIFKYYYNENKDKLKLEEANKIKDYSNVLEKLRGLIGNGIESNRSE